MLLLLMMMMDNDEEGQDKPRQDKTPPLLGNSNVNEKQTQHVSCVDWAVPMVTECRKNEHSAFFAREAFCTVTVLAALTGIAS